METLKTKIAEISEKRMMRKGFIIRLLLSLFAIMGLTLITIYVLYLNQGSLSMKSSDPVDMLINNFVWYIPFIALLIPISLYMLVCTYQRAHDACDNKVGGLLLTLASFIPGLAVLVILMLVLFPSRFFAKIPLSE